MKRFFALAIATIALCFTMVSTSSCSTVQGDFIYDLEISFFDNLDLLRRSFDPAFEAAGCDMMGSYWHLNGEKKSCDERVKNAFLSQAQAIDNKGVFDVKGETVTLIVQFGSDKYSLATYTFTK